MLVFRALRDVTQKKINSRIAQKLPKKFDLDAIFIATNAAGRSAFNRVAKRMAPLSRDLAELMLDHQKLWKHFNEKGEAIDVEKANFAAAGKILDETWSETVIDKYPTIAKYVSPEESELDEVETASPSL